MSWSRVTVPDSSPSPDGKSPGLFESPGFPLADENPGDAHPQATTIITAIASHLFIQASPVRSSWFRRRCKRGRFIMEGGKTAARRGHQVVDGETGLPGHEKERSLPKLCSYNKTTEV
jgi:hypothetical protein